MVKTLMHILCMETKDGVWKCVVVWKGLLVVY